MRTIFLPYIVIVALIASKLPCAAASEYNELSLTIDKSSVYHGDLLYPKEFNDSTFEESLKNGVYLCLGANDTLTVITYNNELLQLSPFVKLSKKQIHRLFEKYNIEIGPNEISISHGCDSMTFVHFSYNRWWDIKEAILSDKNGIEIDPFIVGNSIMHILKGLHIEDYYNSEYKVIRIIQPSYDWMMKWMKSNGYKDDVIDINNDGLSELFNTIIIDVNDSKINKVKISDSLNTPNSLYNPNNIRTNKSFFEPRIIIENNKSGNKRTDIAKIPSIIFMIVDNNGIKDYTKITIHNDTFQLVRNEYDDIVGFALNDTQTDHIIRRLSKVAQTNHFGAINDYYDNTEAYLWINGKQIYYTSEFKLPADMTGSYSEDKSLDELIRYILNLSKQIKQ